MYSLYRSYTLPIVRVKRDMICREIDSKRDAWDERLIYIKKLIVSVLVIINHLVYMCAVIESQRYMFIP